MGEEVISEAVEVKEMVMVIEVGLTQNQVSKWLLDMIDLNVMLF